MKIYGRGYVMHHCVNVIKAQMEERRYRAYITDALMIMTENTARLAGGKSLTVRWYDAYLPVDTRSGDEIAQEVIKNAGLIVQGGGQ